MKARFYVKSDNKYLYGSNSLKSAKRGYRSRMGLYEKLSLVELVDGMEIQIGEQEIVNAEGRS